MKDLKERSKKMGIQIIFVYDHKNQIHLQGYDISISTSDMRPAITWANEMIIPISYSAIGIIQCRKQIN